MKNIKSDVSMSITQQMMFYKGMKDNNSEAKFTASGAHLFRPNSSNPVPLNKTATITVYKGKLFEEVRQAFSEWGTQVYRLYSGGDNTHLEIEWTVGPIPSSDKVGREVISRFSSDLMTQGVFYTDANGRQILPRMINYRDSWKLEVNEPIAGNYYPVNSRIYIQDLKKSLQLTVLTDRSQGGSSLSNGSIELMLHRITMCDDALGVGEPLHENGSDGKGLVVRGKHYILFDTIENSAKLHRDLAERKYMASLVTVSKADVPTINKWRKLLKLQRSFISSELPPNVHLLTLESLNKNQLLLRLEHFYSKSEDTSLSANVTVSIQGLFPPFKVTGVREMTLEANQYLSEAVRLNWNNKSFNIKPKSVGDNFSVELSAMMIRTLEVTYQ